VLVWTVAAVALHAAVPFQLSRLGGPAWPASAAPAVRTAGLVTVAAGGALMAWALAAHYQQAPRGWPVEPGLMPGYLLRQGPYRLVRNPMYAGEVIVWAGWGLVCASPAVWAGLAIMGTGLAATVRWEERLLLRRFGAGYRAYLAEVPRWVPGNASRQRACGRGFRRHFSRQSSSRARSSRPAGRQEVPGYAAGSAASGIAPVRPALMGVA
jgi:protein-S-isoprenylcysteine O-methyltransferase Ste14